VSLDPEDLESEVERLVLSIASLSGDWKQAIAKSEDRSLTLIVQLDDDERPTSLTFSAAVISTLTSMRAALDVDYVATMT